MHAVAQTHSQTVCDAQARALCDGVKTRAARALSMTAGGGWDQGGVQEEEENTNNYKVDVA